MPRGEDLARRVDHAGSGREKHKPANGIGEAGARHGEALGLRLLRALGVGGEEHLERGAVADLGVERPRRTEAEHRRIAGSLCKGGSNRLGGLGEVGGDRDLRLGGGGGAGDEQGGDGETEHGSSRRHTRPYTALAGRRQRVKSPGQATSLSFGEARRSAASSASGPAAAAASAASRAR